MRNGLAATGKTITAAALIMILVFGAFILGGIRVIKEFGLGLAGGILVDAVIIRMAVVPSVMILLGKSNWWFPKWLEWLPHVTVDPDLPDRRSHRPHRRPPPTRSPSPSDARPAAPVCRPVCHPCCPSAPRAPGTRAGTGVTSRGRNHCTRGGSSCPTSS